MDFRDYAAGEVRELFGRLVTNNSDSIRRSAVDALKGAMAALEAAAAAPPDLDRQVQDLVRGLAEASDAAIARVRTELERDLSTVRGQAGTLREELETESARAATLEADLDAVIEAHRQVDAARVEAEAARDDQARARVAAEDELLAVRERLDAARAEATGLKEALDAEAAQRALIEAELGEELESTRQMLAPARADVARLQEALDAEAARRARLESELPQEIERVRHAAAQAEAEAVRQKESLEAKISEQTRGAADLREELERTRQTLEAARAEAARLQESIESERQHRALLEAELSAELEQTRQMLFPARADIARLQDALSSEAAQRKSLEAELEALRTKPRSGAGAKHHAAMEDAVRALDELSAAATVSDLLATVVRQLGLQFERAATFRVRGSHLEGEHASGLETHLDVTKLSIPLGVDSVLTRAATHGAVEEATGSDLAETPTPLGGEPEAALALPIPFQGETFAVAYADASRPLSVVQRGFASLVVKQAGIQMTRLTQELKTTKELGDYAALLLQEAEHMFLADLESGRPEQERRKRLQETLECARQLYAQRAALEGTAAARLLDDQIGRIVNAPAPSAFAKDLAAASTPSESRRNAS